MPIPAAAQTSGATRSARDLQVRDRRILAEPASLPLRPRPRRGEGRGRVARGGGGRASRCGEGAGFAERRRASGVARGSHRVCRRPQQEGYGLRCDAAGVDRRDRASGRCGDARESAGRESAGDRCRHARNPRRRRAHLPACVVAGASRLESGVAHRDAAARRSPRPRDSRFPDQSLRSVVAGGRLRRSPVDVCELGRRVFDRRTAARRRDQSQRRHVRPRRARDRVPRRDASVGRRDVRDDQGAGERQQSPRAAALFARADLLHRRRRREARRARARALRRRQRLVERVRAVQAGDRRILEALSRRPCARRHESTRRGHRRDPEEDAAPAVHRLPPTPPAPAR